ncbi:uncharacterized protein DUF4352 [Rhodococcus sp. OK519]|uniref:DUF4352 domain-containing protein n=1 Tax=Rhodococcus sp. OK519 TaxID=2135729 RepID=UPI000D36C15A|nr:uncharacterized protein DUF4352 [Rhodococcus sp. OK519]
MTNSVPPPAPGQPQNPYGQAPQGYPAPPAPPAPAKKKKWPWIVGAVVVLFVIIAIAGGGGDKDKADEAAPAASNSQPAGGGAPAAAPAAAPAKSAPGIGAEVRDGKFGFVVTGIETGVATVGDNPYLQKEAQGQFVLVHLNVTNIADKPQSYFASNQKLIDAKDREFSTDEMAAINLNAETAIGGQINPGITQSTTIVFDIPADATPKELEVHDSAFSGGETISLTP